MHSLIFPNHFNGYSVKAELQVAKTLW